MFGTSSFARSKKRQSTGMGQRSLTYQPLEARRVLTTYVVTTTDDTIGNSQDGLISLREAIIASNTNAAYGDAAAGSSTERDEIRFHSSIFGETITLNHGQLTITDQLIIRGGESGITIDGDHRSRIFSVVSTDTTIAGLTLTGGSAHVGGAVAYFGNGHSLLFRMNLTSNVATGAGGGAMYNAGHRVFVTDCLFETNTATNTGGAGGAIRSTSGTVALLGGQVRGNHAARAGGGISVVNGTLFATDVVLGGLEQGDGNTAGMGGSSTVGFGGGLHIGGSANPRVVFRSGGLIAGNLATISGGGLWNQVDSTLVVRNGTVIEGNEAAGNGVAHGGGGVFNRGRFVMLDSTIEANAASGTFGSGGGIFSERGQVVVTESQIAANTAVRAGGGVEIVHGFARFNDAVIGGTVGSEGNIAGAGGSTVPGQGGGLHIRGTNGTRVVLEGGLIGHNQATTEGGGAWVNVGSELILRSGITFSANSTTHSTSIGGGAFTLGRLHGIDAHFEGNTSVDRGGGVFVEGTGTAVFVNSTINGNDGGRLGGGIYNRGFTRLADSTVTLNVVSQDGGGIFREAGATTVLDNAIVVANLPNDFNT